MFIRKNENAVIIPIRRFISELVAGKPFFRSIRIKGEDDHYYSKKLYNRKEDSLDDGGI